MKPFFFAVLFLAAATAQAVTITSGSFGASYNFGNPPWTSSGFSGPELSIGFEHLVPGRSCVTETGCNISFNQTVSVTMSPSINRPAGATITYGGTTYIIDPYADPTASLILNLTFVGPTVFVPATLNNSVYVGSTTNVPFTMTGTVTAVSRGVTIFTNLALTGSGTASYSFYNPPTQDYGYTQRWSFAAPATSDSPEPATYATMAFALAGLGLAKLRRR